MGAGTDASRWLLVKKTENEASAEVEAHKRREKGRRL